MDRPIVRQTLVTRPGATTEIMGAANDGAWPEMQIRQTAEDAGEDCDVQNWEVVCSGTKSQQSRACAIVVINSNPIHREAHEARNFRTAEDRGGPLVITWEIKLDARSHACLRMYHYPTQNGALDLISDPMAR